ncbi:MAG TPA: hypothetical protein VJ989_08905 [Solirubrobacterales bacterium]|nr:hypothetical protein [Solirubrobacterales bacterium]
MAGSTQKEAAVELIAAPAIEKRILVVREQQAMPVGFRPPEDQDQADRAAPEFG